MRFVLPSYSLCEGRPANAAGVIKFERHAHHSLDDLSLFGRRILQMQRVEIAPSAIACPLERRQILAVDEVRLAGVLIESVLYAVPKSRINFGLRRTPARCRSGSALELACIAVRHILD